MLKTCHPNTRLFCLLTAIAYAVLVTPSLWAAETVVAIRPLEYGQGLLVPKFTEQATDKVQGVEIQITLDPKINSNAPLEEHLGPFQAYQRGVMFYFDTPEHIFHEMGVTHRVRLKEERGMNGFETKKVEATLKLGGAGPFKADLDQLVQNHPMKDKQRDAFSSKGELDLYADQHPEPPGQNIGELAPLTTYSLNFKHPWSQYNSVDAVTALIERSRQTEFNPTVENLQAYIHPLQIGIRESFLEVKRNENPLPDTSLNTPLAIVGMAHYQRWEAPDRHEPRMTLVLECWTPAWPHKKAPFCELSTKLNVDRSLTKPGLLIEMLKQRLPQGIDAANDHKSTTTYTVKAE